MMRYVATVGGVEREFDVERTEQGVYRIALDGRQFEVDLRRVGSSSFSAIIGTETYDFEVVRDGGELVVTSRRGTVRVAITDEVRRAAVRAHRPEAAGRAEIRAMMPGRVVTLLVQEGERVEIGQGVVVVEAMKMENEVRAPRSGVVASIKVACGQAVEKGELLAIIE